MPSVLCIAFQVFSLRLMLVQYSLLVCFYVWLSRLDTYFPMYAQQGRCSLLKINEENEADIKVRS